MQNIYIHVCNMQREWLNEYIDIKFWYLFSLSYETKQTCINELIKRKNNNYSLKEKEQLFDAYISHPNLIMTQRYNRSAYLHTFITKS